jgi:hypothetical protein
MGRSEKPKGCLTVLKPLAGLVTVAVTVTYRSSVVGAEVLSEISHVLLVALAVGWLVRCLAHAQVDYFRRTEVEGVWPWALLLTSVVDAIFGLLWLGGAVALIVLQAGPLPTAVATATACLVSFLLALANHLAARAAKRPRSSEWVREKFRDPLDPGRNTWPGWLLLKIIDGPSPVDQLSTYVAGSLATLLIVLALIASAAMSNGEKAEAETGQAGIGKTAEVKKGGGKVPAPSLDAPTTGAENVIQATVGIHLLCLSGKISAETAAAGSTAEAAAYLCSVLEKNRPTGKLLILVPKPKR